jgi:hypothetical protein
MCQIFSVSHSKACVTPYTGTFVAQNKVITTGKLAIEGLHIFICPPGSTEQGLEDRLRTELRVTDFEQTFSAKPLI